MSFNPKIAAQMSAFFADKEGGAIYILKLMKLLYLADRLSMERFDEPISWDRMVSMNHGPALSNTLNFINGFHEPAAAEAWEEWIKDREDHQVSVAKKGFGRRDLDQLSDADLEVLQETWDKFGAMDRWQLCRYTHENCPEWKDPEGSSFPIHYKDIFRALGRSADEVIQASNHIREKQKLDSIFAAL